MGLDCGFHSYYSQVSKSAKVNGGNMDPMIMEVIKTIYL